METTTLDHCVITVPDGTKPLPVIVVYGGLYGWEGEWLTKHIPTQIKQSAIFVLPSHYTNDLKQCLDEMRAEVPKERLSSYSLCGYSRGGVEVYRYRSLEQWKFLGLIDPTAPTMGGFNISVLDPFKEKLRCVYWVPNWGKTGYGGRVPAFAAHLRKLKIKMTEQEMDHKFMPDFFFKTYGADLLS